MKKKMLWKLDCLSVQQKKVVEHLSDILSFVESQEIIDNFGRAVFGRRF
jgi:hypothetical protein